MQSDPETTNRSAPVSPVIGLIENSIANLPNVGKPGTSNEPNPKAPKLNPSAATRGTSSATAIGSDGAEGSRNPAVQVVPFQSLPQSTQEEVGKELFDDPLLSIDNVKKLTDYMQWSFKYTKSKVRHRSLNLIDCVIPVSKLVNRLFRSSNLFGYVIPITNLINHLFRSSNSSP